MNEHHNYGFDPDKVKILPEHYIFGASLALDVLREDGQWEDVLPTYEPQTLKDGEDEDGCTVWGSQNQVETLIKALFGIEPNYSERYTYNLCGINPPGADPQLAYESIRTQGLIGQELLPVSDTLAEFMTPRPMSNTLLGEGKKWLGQYSFGHEWVVSDNMKAAIITALKYSPIGLSVTAWFKNGDVYIDNGQPNCHWVLCYGYETRPDGVYLKVFDSYDQSKKILDKDHKIQFAKRILITKLQATPTVAEKKSPFARFTDCLQNLLGKVKMV